MGTDTPKKKKMPKTHLETQGVKKYDRLRKYLGLIYLYGCFDAETLARVNGCTVKDYNAVMDLLWKLIWPDVEPGKSTRSMKRNPKILRRYAASAQNRMSDSYMMYPMDHITRLLMYLLVLRRLGQGPATAIELTKGAEDKPGEFYQNGRNYAVKMADYGYVAWEKGSCYRLEEDPLVKLSDEALQQLHTYVCFAAGVTYPRVPGSFLRRTVERELLRRGKTLSSQKLQPADAAFVLRHNSSHNIFDEEVVFRLLHMIEKKQLLRLNGTLHLPIELRIDRRLGRWYVLLAAMVGGTLQPVIKAVSRLELPVPAGDGSGPGWEQAAEVVKKAFGSSMFSGLPAASPVEVAAKLHFGSEQGRKDQFARELRMGAIEATPEGEYYRALVSDPLELLPLLRAYSPWLEVLPGHHDLQSRLKGSLAQMKQNLRGAAWQPAAENRRTFEKDAFDDGDGNNSDDSDDTKKCKLLNPFQSRQLQFCLDALACAQGGGEESDFVSRLAKRYGITDADRIVRLLKKDGLWDAKDLRLPMSTVEREYLQYILDPDLMPEVSLFLTAETQAALRKTAPGWAAHIRQFRSPGMQLPENPGPEGFRLLIRAIRERREVSYTYRARGSEEERQTTCLPWKLEYSAYDRRWWVIFYEAGETPRTVKATLNNLRNITLLKPSPVTEDQIYEAMENLRMDQPVQLRIRDAHNALKRCFAVFENQEVIRSGYTPEQGYTLTLSSFRFDEEELLRQLMYLGPNVSLQAPPSLCDALARRLEQAQVHNGQNSTVI